MHKLEGAHFNFKKSDEQLAELGRKHKSVRTSAPTKQVRTD